MCFCTNVFFFFQGIRFSSPYDDGTAEEDLSEPEQLKRLWMHEKTGELNLPQQRAVKQALSALDLGLIHGPPGTGKTTTIVCLIAEMVSRGLRCIIAAPSNIAVDNMLERCAAIGVKGLCRLGHPVRMQDAIKKYSLEHLVHTSEEFALCRDVRAELQKTFQKKKPSKAEFIKIKAERTALRKELKQREKTAVTRVLQAHSAIFCTCSGASQMLRNISRGKDHLEYMAPFDVAIVDEAGQGTEVQTWLPLLAASKAVLAGDHKQLGATVLSEEAVGHGMQLSLFQRMQDLHGDKISTLLSIQYRMHQKIMAWSSEQFYDGHLTAHQSCASKTLAELLDKATVRSELLQLRDSIFTPSMNTEIFLDIAKHPFVFCDTTGCDWAHEDQTVQTIAGVQESKGNQGEANCVLQYVKLLIAHGIQPDNINVITPYNKQVQVIRALTLADEHVDVFGLRKIQINTVDSFQGRENDVVVLSLVRSNHGNNVGFLADERRLNVAVTRAKKHVFIVGNADTISKTPVLKSMTTYADARGYVFSAEMLANDECMELSGPAPTAAVSASAAAVQPKSRSDPKPGAAKNVTTAGGGKKQKKPGQKGYVAPGAAGKTEVEKKEEPSASSRTARYDNIVDSDDIPSDSDSEDSLPDFVHPARVPKPAVEEQPSASASSKPATKEEPVDESSQEKEKAEDPKLAEGNKLLQQLAQEREQRKAEADKKRRAAIQNEARAQQAEKMKLKAKNKELKKKGGYPDTKTDVNDDDDFDAILEEAQQDHKTCHAVNCKKSVVLMGTLCSFCRKTFCLTHAQAEMHGCGDAARSAARSAWIDGGVKKMVGTNPKKPGSNPSRTQLETNLNKKLDSAKSARTAQPKGKAKPKKRR